MQLPDGYTRERKIVACQNGYPLVHAYLTEHQFEQLLRETYTDGAYR